MFRVFYDEQNKVVYITNDMNELPTDSRFSYITVETLPEYNPYRQCYEVINRQLVVVDLELTAEQEAEIQRIETITKINEYKLYLEQTDYIANKLSEIVARAIISGSNDDLIDFDARYQDILSKRNEARYEINQLELTISEE